MGKSTIQFLENMIIHIVGFGINPTEGKIIIQLAEPLYDIVKKDLVELQPDVELDNVIFGGINFSFIKKPLL